MPRRDGGLKYPVRPFPSFDERSFGVGAIEVGHSMLLIEV